MPLHCLAEPSWRHARFLGDSCGEIYSLPPISDCASIRRVILSTTTDGFSHSYIHESDCVFLPETERTQEMIAARFDMLSDLGGQHHYAEGGARMMKFVKMAAQDAGISLG